MTNYDSLVNAKKKKKNEGNLSVLSYHPAAYTVLENKLSLLPERLSHCLSTGAWVPVGCDWCFWSLLHFLGIRPLKMSALPVISRDSAILARKE